MSPNWSKKVPATHAVAAMLAQSIQTATLIASRVALMERLRMEAMREDHERRTRITEDQLQFLKQQQSEQWQQNFLRV